MENALQFECRFCKNKHYKKIVTTFDHYSKTNSSIDIVQCQKCRICSIYPHLDKETHNTAYSSENINPLIGSNFFVGKFTEKLYDFFHPYSVKWRRKRIQKEIGVGQLLDVGCRNGDFLQEMRRQLWEVVGVGKKSIQGEYASKTLGLKIYYDLIQLVPKYENHFDVITFWHSLDHFLDPREALELAISLLKENGLIYVALPNLISLDFLIYHKYWAFLDAPRRLHHFSPVSMKKFVKMHGLQLIKSTVIPYDIYYNCILSEKIFIEKKFSKKRFKNLYYIRAFSLALIMHILSVTNSGPGMLYVLKQNFPKQPK